MNVNDAAKRILCYGDSLTFGRVPGRTERFSPSQRWTGVLQRNLGLGFEIIEEGLRLRTTNLYDPEAIGRNGLEYFYGCFLSHLPLDLVIFLLGTNDLQEKYHRDPDQIAHALKDYLTAINFACKFLEEKQPRLLLVSPPLVDEKYLPAETKFTGAEEKSKQLSKIFLQVARDLGAEFLDAAQIVSPSAKDGLHLDVEGNRKLGEAAALKIKEILG